MSMILLIEIATQANAFSWSLAPYNEFNLRAQVPWNNAMAPFLKGNGRQAKRLRRFATPFVLPFDSLGVRAPLYGHGVTWTTARLGICWGVGCRNRNRLKRAGPGRDGRLD
jgi:hypothetical protein